MAHKPVLLKEIISGLDVKGREIFVDMTIGEAGHSYEILKNNPNVTFLGIDADLEAVSESDKKLSNLPNQKFFEVSYFDQIKNILEKYKIEKIDKVLLDFGLRSSQIDESNRGFSFKDEGPLEMTFKKYPTEQDVTASDVVNSWEEKNLADIIYGFGEETFSRRIAEAIVNRRKISPIKSAKELAEIIYEAVPFWYRHRRIHPATKTFQAIRIAVNRELEQIEKTLEDAFSRLSIGGRIAAISFHSLEDRIVKRIFNQFVEKKIGKLVNKKPTTPQREEIINNPRSRSAKLRIIEKIK